MLSTEWGVGQMLWSMLYFFLLFMWIMLLIRVVSDIFRSKMSGVAKVLWLLFVIVLPFLGVFAYIIVRGRDMAENDMKAAQAQEQAFRSYVQSAAGTTASPADELARLADLRDRGVIDANEFAALKAKVFS